METLTYFTQNNVTMETTKCNKYFIERKIKRIKLKITNTSKFTQLVLVRKTPNMWPTKLINICGLNLMLYLPYTRDDTVHSSVYL